MTISKRNLNKNNRETIYIMLALKEENYGKWTCEHCDNECL